MTSYVPEWYTLVTTWARVICLICMLTLGLSDSEIFTITIVERVVFTIMNTITTVDLLTISIHNTKIKHGFLNFYELSQF